MWCAVHVRDGDEARTESFVKGLLSGKLDARCFHLTRSRRKKYGMDSGDAAGDYLYGRASYGGNKL